MLLSNCEIHKAIDEGRLIIDPEPLPRIPTVGQDCPYDAHTVNLKLDTEILLPKPGKYIVDLRGEGSLPEFIDKHSETIKITDNHPFPLQPKQFVLGKTVERIELPLKGNPPYLAARIEGKSSRARCGLLVHCTAPIIHPEFSGYITLEITNLSPSQFMLYPNMDIAQLLVEQVYGDIISNISQFQHQKTTAGLKN